MILNRNIGLEVNQYKTLKEVSNHLNTPMSQIIREALNDYLNKLLGEAD